MKLTCFYEFVEMLYKFTEEETLEGKIYRCEKCNGRFSSTAENYLKKNLLLIQNKCKLCTLKISESF